MFEKSVDELKALGADITTAEKQTEEGEQVRAQAMAEGMVQQYALQAVQQMADIQDLRGKYF